MQVASNTMLVCRIFIDLANQTMFRRKIATYYAGEQINEMRDGANICSQFRS